MLKLILPAILIVYFLFTSGFVFEATKTTDLSQMQVPYSFALSGERTGIVGIYNNDDVVCVKWLANNAEMVIIADINGYILLQGYVQDWNKLKVPVDPYKALPHYFPQPIERVDFSNMPEHCYLFLTTWNMDHNQIVEVSRTTTPGMREVLPLPNFDYPVAFKSGKSVVLKK